MLVEIFKIHYVHVGHVIPSNLDIVKKPNYIIQLKKDHLFEKRIILTGNLIEIFILRQLENIRLFGQGEKRLIVMSLINGNIRLRIILKIK